MKELEVGKRNFIGLKNSMATIVVYNLNPLIIGFENVDLTSKWFGQAAALEKWYKSEMPEDLKSVFKKENMWNISFENLRGHSYPENIVPIVKNNFKNQSKIKINMKLDVFKDKDYIDRDTSYWIANQSFIGINGIAFLRNQFGSENVERKNNLIPIFYIEE